MENQNVEFRRRDREILQGLRDGHSPAEIAQELDTSLGTIRKRMTRIRVRVGLARGAYPIVRFALQREDWMKKNGEPSGL